jgi:hypothetical protein
MRSIEPRLTAGAGRAEQVFIPAREGGVELTDGRGLPLQRFFKPGTPDTGPR